MWRAAGSGTGADGTLYLFLGQSAAVPRRAVIGIFDLDNSTYSRHTRDFLARAEKEGRLTDVSGSLPKSFVLTRENGENRVYLSQLNSSTLSRRWSGFLSLQGEPGTTEELREARLPNQEGTESWRKKK